MKLIAVLASSVLGFGALASGEEAFFMGVGDLPGGAVGSEARDISDDGTVVVGWSYSASSGDRQAAFRWTQAGGMVPLGDLPGGRYQCLAFCVSADGSHVAGQSSSTASTEDLYYLEACRWVGGGGPIAMGVIPGASYYSSVATAISGDGAVIIGQSSGPSGFQAFRWTQAGGMVGLGDLPGGYFQSTGTAVSADGSVVVGTGSAAVYSAEAFRWTQAGGMIGLGDLPGGMSASYATGVSADGSVVVGRANSTSGYEAFRWTQAGGMVGLGDLPGGDFLGAANAVSADGTVIVGRGRSSTYDEAMIWTAEEGMRNLRDVLVNEGGLDLTGWTLSEAWAVAADGRTIVGNGINPSGQAEGWIACIGSAPRGACCNPSTLECNDDVLEADCQEAGEVWSQSTLCAQLDPPCGTGACCNRANYSCTEAVLEAECQGPDEEWNPGTGCAELDPPCEPLCELSGHVFDVETGDSIVGAEVIVAGEAPVLTNSLGEFSLVDLTCGDTVVTVTMTGYSEASETVNLSSGSQAFVHIAMTPEAIGVVEVRGRYCGPDKHVYYLNGIPLDETFTAKVNWGTQTPGSVKFITPQGEFGGHGEDDTWTRTFNVGGDFGENGRLTVVAVSGDDPPVESEPYVANFKVISLPPGMSDTGWVIPLSSKLKYAQASQSVTLPLEGVGAGTIPDWVPLYGREPYTVQLGFRLTPEVSGDGSGTAGVGTLSTGGSAPAEFGGGKWKFALGGKATWKYDGTEWHPGGALEIGLNASGNLPRSPRYYVVWVWLIPIPVYWQGKIGASTDASIAFQDWTADPLLPTLSGQYTVKPTAGIRAGVGVADTAAVEGNLGGSAPLVIQYPAEPTVKGVSIGFSGSLKLVAWKYSREWPVLNYKWNLYTGGTDPLAGALHGPQGWSQFTLLPRDYMKSAYAEFHGGTGLRGAEAILQTNVYPYLAPSLVAVGDDARLVWLYDDPARTSVNGTELVFSASAEDTWSPPVAVADDGTADFAPVLAAMPGGDLLAAWENVDMVLPEETDVQTLASHLEIAAAAFDHSTETWSGQTNLTSNAYLDRSPRISVAGSNGHAMLTWVSNADNNPIGSAAEPNVVQFSLWDGFSWSTPGVAASGVPSIVKSTMAFDGSAALYLYSADMDDNLETREDRELFALSYDGLLWSVQRLTNEPDVLDDNPQVVVTGPGEFMFAWFRGEDIVTAGNLDLSDEVVATSPGMSGGAMDFRLTRTATGQVVLLWQMASEDVVDIWQSLYEPTLGIWSNPVRLTSDDAMERFMSPAFLAGGDLLVAYGKQQVSYETRVLNIAGEDVVLDNVPVPGQSDLCVLRHTAGIDLAVTAGDVTLSSANPAGGETATIIASISNLGELPAAGVEAAFYDGDPAGGGVQIGSIQTIAAPLAGGSADEVSVDWLVPTSGASHDIYVVVDPNLAILDRDRGNNMAAVTNVMKPDLVVDSILAQSAGPDDRIITVRVVNAGVLDASGVEVTLRRDTETGTLIGTLVSAGSLAPGTYRDLSWKWEGAAPFPGGSVPVFAVIDEADTIAEFDEDNNAHFAVLRDNEVLYDCNLNGYDDAHDLAIGTSPDANGNGVPDECDASPPGDIDGDGDVDQDDTTVFISVLLGTDVDPGHMNRADLDSSGTADGLDVHPFVDALLTP